MLKIPIFRGINQVKKIAKKAGLPERYSIHSLRHTHATLIYKTSGYNLRLVQQQLGHSSPTVTSVYSAVLNQDLEKAVENLELDEWDVCPTLLTYLKLATLPEVLAIIPTILGWDWIHIV